MAGSDSLKIATLLGSLRKGSYNAALERALPALAPAGMTLANAGSIRDLPIYDGDVEAQGFPAPVTAMAERLRAAEGILIVSPEYNYSIPGGLKNAIDWLSRLPDQPFKNKPVAIQSASMGVFGGARMQYHLRQSMVFLNAYVLNAPEVMVGQAQNKVDAKSGELTDQKTREFIGKQLAAFAAFIRSFSPR